MTELRGVEFLRNKLNQKRARVLLRYKYYEMKNATQDFNITMPPEWNWLKEVLGWSAKAVDSLADRLVFREFEEDNFSINQIYSMNSRDILFDSAVLSALISSCCFIYVSRDETGYPRLQVIDGGNATGILDPITHLLTEGYAVLERDRTTGSPLLEAYFVPGMTVYYRPGSPEESIPNPSPYPLLVPVIYRPDAKREFGHSRISRACMGIQQAALRTMKRSEVAAEFYSFPQKYVTGLSQDAEQMDKWKMTISSFLQFDNHFDAMNGSDPVITTVTYTVSTPDDNLDTAVAAIRALENDVTGIAMAPAFASAMARVKVNGVCQYPEFRFGQNPNSFAGMACDVNSTLTANSTSDMAIVGDFASAFRWGYAKQIPLEVIEYGNPDNDAELGDLKGHNQVYLRCEAYLGWAILDPSCFVRVVQGA